MSNFTLLLTVAMTAQFAVIFVVFSALKWLLLGGGMSWRFETSRRQWPRPTPAQPPLVPTRNLFSFKPQNFEHPADVVSVERLTAWLVEAEPHIVRPIRAP